MIQATMQSFSITNSLYNVVEDVEFTFEAKDELTEEVVTVTFEIPKGMYDVVPLQSLFNEIMAPYAEFRYFTPLRRVAFVALEGYLVKFDKDANPQMSDLLDQLGYTYTMEDFGPDYEGDEQWTLSSQFEIWIRCPTLQVESGVSGWPASDSNILARVAVDLAGGKTFHYEPTTQMSIPFRPGIISELTFELLDRQGNSLQVEPDTDWTITMEFSISRGDVPENFPTSIDNPLAPAYIQQSNRNPRDMLKRKAS